MPKVYVVQDNGRFNLLTAERFGAIVQLLPARLQVQIDAASVIETLCNKLIEYGNDDSILCMGDPAAIGIAIAIACFYNRGAVHVLKFDRQLNDYYRLKIDLTGFFEQEATITGAKNEEIDTTPAG